MSFTPSVSYKVHRRSQWNAFSPSPAHEVWVGTTRGLWRTNRIGSHTLPPSCVEADGFVLLGGPLEGTTDVLLIVRASNAEQIRSRLSADPWTRNDLLRISQVVPWTLRLGSLG